MGRHSGLLLSVILTLNVAHARALDEAELATLRADRQGAAEQNAARVLARKSRGGEEPGRRANPPAIAGPDCHELVRQ